MGFWTAISLSVPALCLLWTPAAARPVAEIAGYWFYDAAAQPPLLLSRTGLYRDMAARPRVPSDSIHPYAVNVGLWSDGAEKERFLSVPYGRKITPTDTCGYAFPDSTVLIKNFSIDTVAGDPSSRILIETRFLVVRTIEAVSYYSGLSYHWRRDQSDADLVPPRMGEDALIPVRVGGEAKGLRWHYPTQQECSRCHVPETRGAIGFITPQLDRPAIGRPGVNQLQDLVDQGVLASNPLEGKPDAFHWHALDDTGAGLEVRARSYLAANCSHCHGNIYGNHALVSFDYFDSARSIGYSPVNYRGYAGAPDPDASAPFFLYPGRPDSSYILRRMLSRGTLETPLVAQMPPLATYQADSAAVRVLRDWVCGLGSPATPAEECGLPEVPSRPYEDVGLPPHGRQAPGTDLRAVLRGRVLILTGGDGAEAVRLFTAQGRRIPLLPLGSGRYRVETELRAGPYLVRTQGRVLRLESLP